MGTKISWLLVFLGGGLSLGYVSYLTWTILREHAGTVRMQEISQAIRQGSMAFLRREYKSLAVFMLVVASALALFIDGFLIGKRVFPGVALAYLVGTFISAFTGWLGMNIATLANGRTSHAATTSWAAALKNAFNSGAVMGFSVVGFGLLSLAFIALLTQDTKLWLGFAFGASSVALFLRVGGGIFTKSADVGADLVGKVEISIPEDDSRNPAVIADNVGDNVGDIAGMGSDLFESYVSSIVAAMVLGLYSIKSGSGFLPDAETAMLLPLVLASAGIVISIIGALCVRPGKLKTDSFNEQVRKAHATMNRGFYVSNFLMLFISYFIIYHLTGELILFYALISGLFLGILISLSTNYFTSPHYKPTQEIAQIAKNGSAILIIEGLATGMMSMVIPVLLIIVATLTAFSFCGLLGIAIASFGMLINLGIVLAMDCYGPIADNAAGIAQMAGLGKEVRERCEALDSVGNTTAALGKGFSVGAAALSALAWLATYFEETKIVGDALAAATSIMKVDVISGALLGSMLPYAFSALSMKSVGQGSFAIVEEVRRQFREIKGILEGTAKPDYVNCVDITTRKALKSMLLPGIIVIVTPLALGFTLGAASVAGLLLGALVSGFILGLIMANAGGTWDNAKKIVESGEYGGKGSDAHKAAVIGDTVGDPLKDTAGPSLNILIKLVGKVAVIFAPLFGGTIL